MATDTNNIHTLLLPNSSIKQFWYCMMHVTKIILVKVKSSLIETVYINSSHTFIIQIYISNPYIIFHGIRQSNIPTSWKIWLFSLQEIKKPAPKGMAPQKVSKSKEEKSEVIFLLLLIRFFWSATMTVHFPCFGVKKYENWT